MGAGELTARTLASTQSASRAGAEGARRGYGRGMPPSTDPATHPAAGTHRQGRSPAVIRAELAEAQRYLTDAPPHHGAGVRQSLEARIARLQRELAASDS